MELWATWNGETVYHLSESAREVVCGVGMPEQSDVKLITALPIGASLRRDCYQKQRGLNAKQPISRNTNHSLPTVHERYVVCRFCQSQIEQQRISDHMNCCPVKQEQDIERKRKAYRDLQKAIKKTNRKQPREQKKDTKQKNKAVKQQQSIPWVSSHKEPKIRMTEQDKRQQQQILYRLAHPEPDNKARHDTERPWFRGNPTHRRTEEV